MEEVTASDELVMKLLHYFITEKGYNPIILHGAKDEIWLENLNGDYKIVRIVSNYIHNNEQFDFDILKTKQIMRKIKKTTFSLSINALSIFTNIGENVNFQDNSDNIQMVNIQDIKDLKKCKTILEIFPDITKVTDFKEKGFELLMKLTGDINKKNEQENVKAEDVFKLKPPVITITLIAINVIVFALMYLLGDGSYSKETLTLFGAFKKELVLGGQYWRLITSMFVHIGVLHLLFNCYALYVIGRQLESFLGRLKFVLIYLLSGMCGSLLSLCFPITLSAGASGAIFGLLGSLLYFGYNYRVYLGGVLKSQIIPLILANLMLGLVLPGINNASHIGGLVGGILITMALGIKYKSTKSQQINGFILFVLFVAFLMALGFFI